MTLPAKYSNTFIAGLGVLIATGVFLLDMAIPLGVADGILYVVLVLIALFAKNRKFIYVAAVTGGASTGFGFFLSPPRGGRWTGVPAPRACGFPALWEGAPFARGNNG
ncbi:MAG TPA: hypothetical protein QGI40_02340, partial [Nitrospinaceae bacterium]|nr:hypothetical protein [Nitrospinaceae bacterium]